MIVHPDFLQNILGHFYKKPAADGPWVLKDKAGFIQTPQDFWNVDAADPLVHCARFFYGPMLQVRPWVHPQLVCLLLCGCSAWVEAEEWLHMHDLVHQLYYDDLMQC